MLLICQPLSKVFIQVFVKELNIYIGGKMQFSDCFMIDKVPCLHNLVKKVNIQQQQLL